MIPVASAIAAANLFRGDLREGVALVGEDGVVKLSLIPTANRTIFTGTKRISVTPQDTLVTPFDEILMQTKGAPL